MVNGRDAPCNADPQEDVHRVTSGHVPHARVGVLVLACGHLARERVCNKITYLDPTSSTSSPFHRPHLSLSSHQIYRLSIIPRSRGQQQYDTVISFLLYTCVGWDDIGKGAHVSRRKLSAELAARRDSWQHVVYTNFQFTLLRAYKTNLVREQVYIYRGNILINTKFYEKLWIHRVQPRVDCSLTRVTVF